MVHDPDVAVSKKIEYVSIFDAETQRKTYLGLARKNLVHEKAGRNPPPGGGTPGPPAVHGASSGQQAFLRHVVGLIHRK